ncbi:MAG: 2-oxoacid:acceptor oxidoreductase subunit alpha [Candidatus Hydrogenedentes bacterium]|nr:2-oxoacid:acceptor oxidoreductase subunit alpha [Candidatus Hydrogenedentota bacterium]
MKPPSSTSLASPSKPAGGTKAKRRDISVRFCGIAGDGVVTCGRILAGACASLGLDLMVNDIFSAEIRGKGKSTTTVRFSSRIVHSMGDGVEVLVGLAGKESIEEIKDVRPGGCVIYGSSIPGDLPEDDSLAAHVPPNIHGFGVPLRKLANQATGSNQGKNIVAMGALCYLYSLPQEAFIEQLRKNFGRKSSRALEVNIKAFTLGFEYCKEHYPLSFELEVLDTLEPRPLYTGNDALAHGALDWGLKFFAGYPITPATKIMEICAKELPKNGGWTIQVEDEIAAISNVMGAFFAGKRAMTSTAGPGLSLMSEMIGLAVMAEIPAVIVDVQRGGPATGMPTKVEQGDLNIALYGGAGDCPRVVMAPSTVRECYTGIQLALDLAEKYQTPVIFLSDLFLGQRMVTTSIPKRVERDRCTRKKPFPGELGTYERFKITEDGVSPLLIPGEEGGFYTITGLEHTPSGNPNFESNVHSMMTEKRYRKMKAMCVDLPPADVLGDKDALIGIVTWGSTLGSVVEGMELAREQGVKSKVLKSIMINPQHEDSFREFFASSARIIVPEVNYEGQYAALLKSRYGIQPVEMHISAVDPVSPAKIANRIIEVQDELTH